jgi:HEAT repeat protein
MVGLGILAGCEQPAAPPAAPRPTPVAAAPDQAPPATAAAPAAEPAPAAGGPAVDALRATLARSTDGRERVQAIDALADLGQRAKAALPELLTATADADPRPRWHAARAIGLIGEDAISALPTLVKLLGDEDPIVVMQAASAIGLVRQDDGRDPIPEADAALYAATIEPLARACVHADPRVRRAAARNLRIVHSDPRALAGVLCDMLDDSDPSAVLPAVETLAELEDHSVPVLLAALAEPKSRHWAMVALAEIGPEAATAVPTLAKIAAEGELEDRLQAILTLAEIGPEAATAAPALLAALESGAGPLPAAAAFALGRARVAAADDALARAAAGDDAFLGSIAAWARAEIKPQDAALVADALARLRRGISADGQAVRKGAISGLSDIAENLDEAGRGALAGEFVTLLEDPDEEVGVAAGAALVRLGSVAVPALRRRLAEPGCRLQTLGVLGAIGSPAAAAVPDVAAFLTDPDPEVASEAAVALAAVGAAAEPAVELLRKLLGDETPADLRYSAAFALGRVGPAAEAAVPRLVELSKSSDEIMATLAVWAALKIDPADRSLFDAAIPLLRRALRGEREVVRLEAAVALGDIGPPAKSAIPVLELVSEDDPNSDVREAAAGALAKIRPR